MVRDGLRLISIPKQSTMRRQCHHQLGARIYFFCDSLDPPPALSCRRNQGSLDLRFRRMLNPRRGGAVVEGLGQASFQFHSPLSVTFSPLFFLFSFFFLFYFCSLFSNFINHPRERFPAPAKVFAHQGSKTPAGATCLGSEVPMVSVEPDVPPAESAVVTPLRSSPRIGVL